MVWPAVHPVGLKLQKRLVKNSIYVIIEINTVAKAIKPLASKFRT
jgi:hypothetical protein